MEKKKGKEIQSKTGLIVNGWGEFQEGIWLFLQYQGNNDSVKSKQQNERKINNEKQEDKMQERRK